MESGRDGRKHAPVAKVDGDTLRRAMESGRDGRKHAAPEIRWV